jgi:hypothetical protein
MYRQETLAGGKEMLLRCLRDPRNVLGFKRKEYDAKYKKCVIKNLIICPLSLVIKATERGITLVGHVARVG